MIDLLGSGFFWFVYFTGTIGNRIFLWVSLSWTVIAAHCELCISICAFKSHMGESSGVYSWKYGAYILKYHFVHFFFWMFQTFPDYPDRLFRWLIIFWIQQFFCLRITHSIASFVTLLYCGRRIFFYLIVFYNEWTGLYHGKQIIIFLSIVER